MVKSSDLSRSSKPPRPRARGGGRTSAPAADTQARILAAARAEFLAKGLEGARMRAIAARGNVNPALLHYYFRSKERLYVTVLEDVLGAVWGGIQAAFQAAGKPEGLEPILRTLVGTYVRTLAANPDFPLVMFRELAGGGRHVQPLLAPTLARFGEVPQALFRALKAEIAAGRARPVQPAHFFLNLMGMCVITFLARPFLDKLPLPGLEITQGEAFLEERVRAVIDMALHGILAGK